MFQHEAADITTGMGPGTGRRKDGASKNQKGSLCQGKPEDPQVTRKG